MIRFLLFSLLLTTLPGIAQPPLPKPIAGRSSGLLPYLEYGFGYDRLGSARITNLDTGVVLNVVDSTIVNYKVQLSKNHFAYLPKGNFTRDTSIRTQPFYLTSSWLAYGDDKYDFVSVSLDEKLPYRSIQQTDPSRIIIDIYGAVSNTNWVNQRISTKEVRNIYYEQLEDDVYRIIIDLRHKQHWGYSIWYKEKKLMIRIKRQPAELDFENLKIAVDAGHGGTNTGAGGVTSKIAEKNYTLMIANKLKEELIDKGATVFMTRTGDVTLGMPERIGMLKQEDPDFLISIHLNSSVRDSVKGVSTYYRYIGFRPLTQFIQNRLLETGLADFGNIGSFNFALNGPTDYPNCLVEVAFLSNREDEQLILDPKFHEEVAKKITAGIRDWLKACKEDD